MVLVTEKALLNIIKCILVMAPAAVGLVPAIVLQLNEPGWARRGLALPARVDVAVGHEALLRLVAPLVNQLSCTVTTPQGRNFTTDAPPSDRYEAWGAGCGVRVRNITMADEGRWRLTASRDDHTITAFSAVHVLNATTAAVEPINLSDGATNEYVNLTDQNNAYCTVAKPFTSSVLVAGHCEVQVEKVSRALQGEWSVQLGLPGRVTEITLTPHVSVNAERLGTGFVEDTSAHKLHLYCNLLRSDKRLTFCRFQRSGSAHGYSVRDGLGDSHYSYYGEGFEMRQCGMTVEQPTAEDMAAWRCAVGVEEASTGGRSVMQGLVNVGVAASSQTQALNFKSTDTEEGLRTVLGVNGTEVTVSCAAGVPLAYCWFRVRGQGGVRDFTPGVRGEDGSDMISEDIDSEFWYSGEGLEMGDCGITFARASQSLSGVWTCHMAGRTTPGVELTEEISVRITGHLAASHTHVVVGNGAPATLECRTSEGVKPIDYCRFLSPNDVGLSLDETVTADKAILGRYHYTPGGNLDHGVCSLTIAQVSAEDMGVWTCAAVVNGDIVESSDIVELEIVKARSAASIVGMAFSALVLVAAVALFGAFKLVKRMRQPSSEGISMRSLSNSSTSGSLDSGGSVTQFNATNHHIQFSGANLRT